MNHRGWIFALGLMLPLAVGMVHPAQAQLFGESDEDKAARLAHENGQDSQITALDTRAKALEDRDQALEDKVQSLTQSLSQATGANEQLNHQLQLLNDKLDREEKDFAYRLCMLSAQQLGAAGDQGLNCAAAGTASASRGPAVSSGLTPGAVLPPLGSEPRADTQNIDASGVPRSLGRPPGNLGTLSSSGPSARLVQAPQQGGDSRQFDSAMNLLAKAQYAEASAAFRAYADANPGDQDLSPQAIYWIGDIAFVQQSYPSAISAFAEEIKKYPNSSRSPDSMLKLGQALLASGQTSEGCTALGALRTKYPHASASTLAAAAGARKASCSK
jgi:tol-pal system protein YbgF